MGPYDGLGTVCYSGEFVAVTNSGRSFVIPDVGANDNYRRTVHREKSIDSFVFKRARVLVLAKMR